MGKKKKKHKKEARIKLTIELLVAIAALITSIANLIQAIG